MMTSALTIAKIHAAFRSGELTPRELVDLCHAAIDAREADVQAWVLVDREGAIRLADEQSQWLLSRGENDPLPPLFGIPIAVKDIFDVATWPTKAGSPLREKHVASGDAESVARIREAGAILLGKTHTTEFASFDPSPTHNPWNLAHTPGGSSSGSAAGTACGMCVAALGSQTGGSIVRPASYCGVVGFKPLYGKTPLEGVVPLAPSMDHVGAMARNVGDVARVFGVLAGGQAGGRAGEQAGGHEEQPIRFGVLRDFFCDQAEPENAAVFDAVMVHLENHLGTVATADLGVDMADVHRSHRVIMAFECAAYHREPFLRQRDQYGPRISELISEGLETSRETYVKALDHAQVFRALMLKVMQAFDVLAMPSTHGAAPLMESTGDPRWQNVWSFAGLPAITIPCGFATLNLPLGLQLVGSDDATVLTVAARCEEELDLGDQIDRLVQ
jgi:aspartyl-tRNA(Asn)/glutamyl-tRNA(Gln) amidotransferase subunit A